MSGGNSTGYLYGSYPALGDGIHLGYNWFYADDANGAGRIINNGGGTSRLSMDYGEVVVAAGDVGAAPTATRIDVTTLPALRSMARLTTIVIATKSRILSR